MGSRVMGRDHVGDEYYSTHLYGAQRKFNNNPSGNRTAILQRMYYRILSELAMNRFKWTGLPDNISVRFMEMELYYRALAVFFYDDERGKFLALQGSPASHINMMGDPTHFTVVGPNYVGKRLRAMPEHVMPDRDTVETLDAECVPIWSNYMRVPDLDIVLIYATKFAELDRTIEINAKNARRNKIIVTDENTNLSATNIVREIDSGAPVVKVARPLGDMVQALDLGVHPESVERLHIVKGRLWNECMTLLGIKTANQDKKERLVESEVDANAEEVDSMRAVNLNSRRRAAEQMNALYDLNVEVGYNTDARYSVPDIEGDLAVFDESGEV